jgi:hypothetical protein
MKSRCWLLGCVAVFVVVGLGAEAADRNKPLVTSEGGKLSTFIFRAEFSSQLHGELYYMIGLVGGW